MKDEWRKEEGKEEGRREEVYVFYSLCLLAQLISNMPSPHHSQLTNQSKKDKKGKYNSCDLFTLEKVLILRLKLENRSFWWLSTGVIAAFQAFWESYKMTDVPAVAEKQEICLFTLYPQFIIAVTFFDHFPWFYELLVFREDVLDSRQELCVLALFAGLAPNNVAQKIFRVRG